MSDAALMNILITLLGCLPLKSHHHAQWHQAAHWRGDLEVSWPTELAEVLTAGLSSWPSENPSLYLSLKPPQLMPLGAEVSSPDLRHGTTQGHHSPTGDRAHGERSWMNMVVERERSRLKTLSSGKPECTQFQRSWVWMIGPREEVQREKGAQG